MNTRKHFKESAWQIADYRIFPKIEFRISPENESVTEILQQDKEHKLTHKHTHINNIVTPIRDLFFIQ